MNGEPDLLIGGKWRHASDGGTREIINPADGSVAAVVDEADPRRCARRRRGRAQGLRRRRMARHSGRRACRAARPGRRPAAARQGRSLPSSRRGTPARRLPRAASTSTTSRRCSGTTRKLAAVESDRLVDVGDPAVISRVVREPIGVCVLIAPWNYPLLQMSWKIAPALAAGCTMVAKPSEVTPLTTIAFVHLLEEAGVPDSVVNLVQGSGATLGSALTDTPDVDFISFTGGRGHRHGHLQGRRRTRHQGGGRTRRQESAHRVRRRRLGQRRRPCPHRRVPALRARSARRAPG